MVCGILVMGGIYGAWGWVAAFAGMTMMVLAGCALEASEPLASPTPMSETTPISAPDSLDLLVVVLREAESLGVLDDELADALSDWFIVNMIAPSTDKTAERVRERLSTDQPLGLVIAVLREAAAIGVLSDTMSDLMSELFIEYLIAPATGEMPDAVRGRLSADWGTMVITNPDGSEIMTMEQWSERVNSSHWKPGRSAYSLADLIMNRGGAGVLGERVSAVLGQPVTLDTGTPEYGAKFDSHGGSPSKLDLGIFGRVGSGSGLFVGLEAKVNERFFETDSYDDERGRENRRDYERFIEAAGGKVVVRGEDGFDAHEIMVAGKRVVCVYDWFEVAD